MAKSFIKNTKAELVELIKERDKKIESLKKDLNKLHGSDELHSGTFKFLYSAVNVQNSYLTDLLNRTKMIRHRQFGYDDKIVITQCRVFPDKNECILMMTFDLKQEHLLDIQIDFYKRITE